MISKPVQKQWIENKKEYYQYNMQRSAWELRKQSRTILLELIPPTEQINKG